MPVIDGRWVVEPSGRLGLLLVNNVSSGALYSVGISSRYKIAPIGRGHIVIGNAINYSRRCRSSRGLRLAEDLEHRVRNGIAYQSPTPVFGRQGTVRASYTYTTCSATTCWSRTTTSVAELRRGVPRGLGEADRRDPAFGLNGAFGHDFTAVSLTAGYRF